VTHQIIIIKSASPPPTTAVADVAVEPVFQVTVEYRPSHGMTASQIGNEVARIQREVNQIIKGAPD